MRLVHDKNKTFYADVLLKRRSLYIMNGTARFDYTHEILANDRSYFKGRNVLKGRRISVISRNEPNPEHTKL
jgi:alkylated DNA repair protein alkB family protein 7